MIDSHTARRVLDLWALNRPISVIARTLGITQYQVALVLHHHFIENRKDA